MNPAKPMRVRSVGKANAATMATGWVGKPNDLQAHTVLAHTESACTVLAHSLSARMGRTYEALPSPARRPVLVDGKRFKASPRGSERR